MIRIFLRLGLLVIFVSLRIEGAEKREESCRQIKRSPQKVNNFYKELNRQVKSHRHKPAVKEKPNPMTPKTDNPLYRKGGLKKQLNQFTKTYGPSSYALLNHSIYEVKN